MLPTNLKRAIWEKLNGTKDETGNSLFPFPYEKMSESYLRMDVELDSGVNTIAFQPIQSGVSGEITLPFERRVQQNDVFVGYMIGIAVRKTTTAGAEATLAEEAVSKLFHYVNAQAFPQTNDDNLNAIYNVGELSLEINQKIFIPGIDCYRYKRVPDTQGAIIPAGVAADDDVVTFTNGLEDSKLGPDFAFNPSDIIMLRGDDTAQFAIKLGKAVNMNMAATNGDINYCVLLIKGFLLQNVLQQSPKGR